MADLVKTVLGGAWTLIVGWMLPVFLTLQLIVTVVAPDVRELTFVNQLLTQSEASRQLALLATAVVLGLVLAAAQAPLYRILEGYALWPGRLADRAIVRHRERRRRLVEQHAALAASGAGVRAGLKYERAARYPAVDKQFAPTALGNAIRRFETYAGDRYQLDSQLLWHDLAAAAPERAVTAVGNARLNVDFFVCLLYGAAVTGLTGLGAIAISGGSLRGLVAMALGVGIAVISYRLAIIATDEWDAAVRAVVDHGREGVARAFGLTVPADFTQERHMWRAVNTLVRRPYAYSESKDVAATLTRFRTGEAAKASGGVPVDQLAGLIREMWLAGFTPASSGAPPTAEDKGGSTPSDGEVSSPPTSGLDQTDAP